MIPFERIWVEQCQATQGLRERFGPDKALGYLVGEKPMKFVEAGETRPVFARELPAFVEEVKRLFTPAELRGYLEKVKRVAALGHILADDEAGAFRAASALGEEDLVVEAEEVLRLERIKELLLDPGSESR